ncbi:MAG: MmgE/PrpD family protein [Betaproteobacteria bacterium]|nr:MmgE/PrpD family protein [Betaproteobacteria bacterium]
MDTPVKADYLDALAQFACETRFEDLPSNIVEHCKLILSDTLPVIAAGMQQKEMRSLAARHLPKVAPGRAMVIGTGKRANPLDAALLNAAAGVWLELDEGHFYTNGHPGIHVIPAALAHAQEYGLSGRDLLLAIVLGYEVCGRVGGAYKMRVVVQTHGTFGVIGSTVAVGRLSGLSHSEMRQAINIAASTPLGGNRQTMLDGATIRNYYPAHANFTGQMAVRLVQSGFTGPLDAPSVTFGKILADDFSTERAAADLGRRWLITENYIKLYPSARYVHCAIDALLDALARVPGRKLAPESVERIEVRGYRMLVFCGEKRPKSMFGTQFSTPFSIATILHHARTDLDVFGESAFNNPAVLDLAARVEMIEEPEFNKDFPRRQPAHLKIVLKDGTAYEGKCDVPKGEIGNPHSAQEIERKFYQLATPVWGEALAREIRRSCDALDTLNDVSALAGGGDL